MMCTPEAVLMMQCQLSTELFINTVHAEYAEYSSNWCDVMNRCDQVMIRTRLWVQWLVPPVCGPYYTDVSPIVQWVTHSLGWDLDLTPVHHLSELLLNLSVRCVFRKFEWSCSTVWTLFVSPTSSQPPITLSDVVIRTATDHYFNAVSRLFS